MALDSLAVACAVALEDFGATASGIMACGLSCSVYVGS